MESAQNLSSDLSIVDSKLISNLWTVSSPTQGPNLFINDTMDQLPVSNFKVSPKAKYFPGISFPPEQVYTASAALESIRPDFHDEHAEKTFPVSKTSKNICTNSARSVSFLMMLLTKIGSATARDSKEDI